MSVELQNFIQSLPKTELHVHLEGTLEPEMIFRLAKRNQLALQWESPEELRNAYHFNDLSGFLEVYFKGCEVMKTAEDFYEVTRAYLQWARADGIVHAEVFLGPQPFLDRGVPLEAIMEGIFGAIDEMQEQISCYYLASVIRTRQEREALRLLERLSPWYEHITGFGMGGSEKGYPPSRFAEYFRECRRLGFKTMVHAGEEGPPDYIWEALKILQPDRIDHGRTAEDDPKLMELLAKRQIPLTMCPVSNLKLNGVKTLMDHPLKKMLDAGLCVTINSDDPAYFLAYVNDNYLSCAKALNLTRSDLCKLARNSILASFLPTEEKQKWLKKVPPT